MPATKDNRLLFAVVSLASVAAIAFWGYRWWFSPERAIKSRIAEIAAALSIPARDTELARVTRVARLRRCLAEDVRVRAGGQDVASRDLVLGLVGRWIPPPGGITVEFVDLQVTLDQDGRSARVHLTAKVSGRDARTGEPTIDAREADVGMAKRDGEWVVASMETTETLTTP